MLCCPGLCSHNHYIHKKCSLSLPATLPLAWCVCAFSCALVQLSEDQYRSLNLARGLTAAVCLLLCLLTLALILHYRTSQFRPQHFFLYLTLSTIAKSWGSLALCYAQKPFTIVVLT